MFNNIKNKDKVDNLILNSEVSKLDSTNYKLKS